MRAPAPSPRAWLVPDTYSVVRVHLICSTARRRPWIDPEWRPRLFANASAVAGRRGAQLLCAGGTRDHVHLYLQYPPTMALADLVHAIKASTSRWIHETFSHRKEFRWQAGYAAFSVTPREDTALQAYIRNQETHHRELAFHAEYLGILERHGIDYDLRDVMD